MSERRVPPWRLEWPEDFPPEPGEGRGSTHSARPATGGGSDAEARYNEDGTLDEVVASNVQFVHLEQMDVGHWWLSIQLADGSALVVNLHATRSSRTIIHGRCEREPAPRNATKKETGP